jgi:TRAP-type C4-dicarboxylate transport system permease small subunit
MREMETSSSQDTAQEHLPLQKLESLIHKLALKFSQLAQVALVLVMLVIVANILLRAVWRPITGSYEMVEILGAILLSLGVAHCAVLKSHVAMTFLVERMRPLNRAISDFCTTLISCFFLGYISWGIFKYAAKVYSRGLNTTSLEIPLYPVYFLVGFGIFVLALVSLMEWINSLLVLLKGGKKN